MYMIFHTLRQATPILIRHDCQQQLQRSFRVATGLCGKRLDDDVHFIRERAIRS
jgi:hypothetical protein